MSAVDVDGLLAQIQTAENQHRWINAAMGYSGLMAIAPENDRLHSNRGNALWLADLPEQAEASYKAAIELAPQCHVAWRGLGNCLRDLQRFEDAVEAYERSIALDLKRRGGMPDPGIVWACGQARLGLEDYERSFSETEQRLSLPNWEHFWPAPFWAGGRLMDLDDGKTLWIWTEQGYGDTFQYLRWIQPLLALRPAGEVVLAVEANLVDLLREGLAWLPKPPRVLAKQELEGPPPAAHGPLMSLPDALGGPIPAAPYLRSAHWRNAIDSPLPAISPRAAGPRVGLVWASGRKQDDPFTHREQLKRSLEPRALATLIGGLTAAGAVVVNLQHGEDAGTADGLGLATARPNLDLGDFGRTARVVAQLDLVISVDTAMAHLVGAMGVPGWILLPRSADPRWLRGRSDTPWYPSLRLFRQQDGGSWGEPIRELLNAFTGFMGAPPGN